MSVGATQLSEDLTYGDEPEVSDPKLKELILYICDKCADDPDFGATKLNKILYASDFLAFKHHGESITGSRYTRRDQGPVVRRLPAVREQLIESSDLVVRPVARGRYIQHRYIALREASIDEHFIARQISLVDEVIDALNGMNARNVSDMTHGYAWKVAADGTDIPYESIYLSDMPLDEADVEWARRVNGQYKWEAA